MIEQHVQNTAVVGDPDKAPVPVEEHARRFGQCTDLGAGEGFIERDDVETDLDIDAGTKSIQIGSSGGHRARIGQIEHDRPTLRLPLTRQRIHGGGENEQVVFGQCPPPVGQLQAGAHMPEQARLATTHNIRAEHDPLTIFFIEARPMHGLVRTRQRRLLRRQPVGSGYTHRRFQRGDVIDRRRKQMHGFADASRRILRHNRGIRHNSIDRARGSRCHLPGRCIGDGSRSLHGFKCGFMGGGGSASGGFYRAGSLGRSMFGMFRIFGIFRAFRIFRIPMSGSGAAVVCPPPYGRDSRISPNSPASSISGKSAPLPPSSSAISAAAWPKAGSMRSRTEASASDDEASPLERGRCSALSQREAAAANEALTEAASAADAAGAAGISVAASGA